MHLGFRLQLFIIRAELWPLTYVKLPLHAIFKLVSLKTLKLYGLESSNLRGMLLRVCSCAPGVSFADVHN